MSSVWGDATAYVLLVCREVRRYTLLKIRTMRELSVLEKSLWYRSGSLLDTFSN
jgi:hypothetical protein